MDGHQNILPLAFALMDEENEDTWGWFLHLLRERVVQDAHERITIVSDRHKGIMKAIRVGCGSFNGPQGCHRYCLRHLCSNVMSNYGNQQVKDLAWNAGSAEEEVTFRYHMDKIREINATAHRYLSNITLQKWTLAYDEGSRCGIMTSNMVETFNGVLKGARRLPISVIVEITFSKIASYFINRLGTARQMQAESKYWTWYATNIYTENANYSGNHIVQMVDMDSLSAMVFTPASTRNRMEHYAVNLSERTCSCGNWKHHGIPCFHAIQVCRTENIPSSNFVKWYYETERYLQTYSGKFFPLWDKEYWPTARFKLVYNPKLKIVAARGRTRTTRIPNEMDRPETRARQQYRDELGSGASSSYTYE